VVRDHALLVNTSSGIGHHVTWSLSSCCKEKEKEIAMPSEDVLWNLYDTLVAIKKSYATVHHLCPVCGSEMLITDAMSGEMLIKIWVCADLSCEGTRSYVPRAEQ